MTTQELCGQLDVDVGQVITWIAGGLPYDGEPDDPIFDAVQVREFLIAKGHAEDAVRTVSTIPEAAKALSIHPQTLKGWLAAGCPGEHGRYDTAEIARWRAANLKPAAEPDSKRARWEARRSRAAALKAEMELKEKRGELVNAVETDRKFARHIAEAKAHLDQLPDFVLSVVDVKPAERKAVRATIEAKIRYIEQLLADSLTRLFEETPV